ncbi:MAG: J domain-containing protein [Methylobacter sp.]
MTKFKTHYDSLNVARNAPASVIKAAYKALCQSYHPDKYAGGPDEAVRIMKNINAAYAVLSDTDKRAEHDRWIALQEKLHANHEARRIMHIINQTHAAPPTESSNTSSQKSSAVSGRYREALGALIDSLRLGAGRLPGKLNYKLCLAGIAGIMGIAALTYVAGLKPSAPVSVQANQDVANLLQKARRLLKQGQVAKALSLYLSLAQQGNADAQFQLGLLYIDGAAGVAKDDKLAADWIGKAAAQGHAEAQTKLGFMYATGKGVAQNYYAAVDWSYKAAQQGNVAAQYNLGLMYAEGQGAAKDNSLAFSWYSKAAAQGHARAQYNVGNMYANGLGVEKDSKLAADWYRKAATQGLPEATAALKQLQR